MTIHATPWTREHDLAFRALYPDYNALQQRFPERTLKALKLYAYERRIASRRHVWTQMEVARLKRLYGRRRPTDAEISQAFPALKLGQILSKANHLGFTRERPAPKMLGVSVLDAVRRRAHDEGLSLSELDRLAGTRRYFRQTTRRIVWRNIAAAVEILGGELRPAWDDDYDVQDAVAPKRLAA